MFKILDGTLTIKFRFRKPKLKTVLPDIHGTTVEMRRSAALCVTDRYSGPDARNVLDILGITADR